VEPGSDQITVIPEWISPSLVRPSGCGAIFGASLGNQGLTDEVSIGDGGTSEDTGVSKEGPQRLKVSGRASEPNNIFTASRKKIIIGGMRKELGERRGAVMAQEWRVPAPGEQHGRRSGPNSFPT